MTETKENYFFWHEKEFEAKIRELVCPRCPYFGADQCKNPDVRGCALFRYLPDLVRVAQRMKDPNVGDYAKAVEQNISFQCQAGQSGGCELMDSFRCGLERLLPYVLESVMKTNEILESGSPPAPQGP